MTGLLTAQLPLIASSSGGVRRLRELILELAIMGKLVPPDPSDEPARELLKRMKAEETRLIEAGAIRRQKPLQKITADDQIFPLPSAWVWVRLGEIGDWGAGATPLRGNSMYYGGSIPWFKSGELTSDLIFDSEEKITELALKECSLRENKAGDVLVAMYGATIGKTAILAAPGTTNQAVCACTPFPGLNNRFLLVTLKALRPMLVKMGAGGAQPNISREKIIATVAGLPPLAEQHRIVAKVEELMALCDRLDAQQSDAESAHTQLVKTLLDTLTNSKDQSDFADSWLRIERNFHALFSTETSFDALKKTILQLAVMGKLVRQDPNDEPGTELLKRIQKEKLKLIDQGRIGKEKTLGPIKKDEIPYPIPPNWVWSKIGTYSAFTEYGISEKTFELEDGIPVIKMGDIQGGKVILTGQKKVDRKVEVIFLKHHDLLYNRTNSAELVGKTGLFEGPDNQYTFASYLIRIQCLPTISCPQFLNLAMSAPGFRETQINPHLKQQCGQANVNGTILKNMLVPIPPLAEQHRIVARVEELIALCDRLKSSIKNAGDLQELFATTSIAYAVAFIRDGCEVERSRVMAAT